MPRQRYQYRYRQPQRRHFPLRWVLLIVFILAVAAFPFMEARMLNVEEHVLQVSGLPSNLKNLKIVYATDFHQGQWVSQQRVDDVFNTINALSADIVILGGDYAQDSESAVRFFETCPDLYARLGVFAVLGENDRSELSGDLSRLTRQMQERGITPLVNAVTRVKVGQSYVYIAGADDRTYGFPDVSALAQQLYADDFVIFAGHTPDLMSDVLKAKDAQGDNHWFDLALFGHTHGGQINVMGHTPFSALMPEVGARYLSGWRVENRASILVSNGIGTTHLPIRLFCQPQIHLITLKQQG